MITVTGQRTFKDYLRAQLYHGRSRALLIAGILGTMALLLWLTSRNVLVPAFVALYVIMLRPVYMRVRLKRVWDQTPSSHRGEITNRLDETGFHSKDDEGNPTVTHWDNFSKFRSSKHSFLLYLSPNLYLFLPKRFMSPAEQQERHRLLTERIEQPSRGDSSKGANDLPGTPHP